MKTVKTKEFWIGVLVGAVVVPYVIGKTNVNVRVPAAK